MHGLAYKRSMADKTGQAISRKIERDIRWRNCHGTKSFEEEKAEAYGLGWGQPGRYLKNHFHGWPYLQRMDLPPSWNIREKKAAWSSLDQLKEHAFPVPGRIRRRLGTDTRKMKGSGSGLSYSDSGPDIEEYQKLIAESKRVPAKEG